MSYPIAAVQAAVGSRAARHKLALPWYLDPLYELALGYQPLGAASYAASLVNLANPGTSDATEGAATGWAASRGWIFNNNGYLRTNVNPGGTNKAKSMMVRFAGATNTVASQGLMGFYSSTNNSLLLFFAGAEMHWYSSGSYVRSTPAHPAAGTFALAGNKAYLDGVEVGTINAGINLASSVIDIGGTAGSRLLIGDIIAAAYSNNTWSPSTVAALHAAMVHL